MPQYIVSTHLIDPIFTLYSGDLLDITETGSLEQNLTTHAVFTMDDTMLPVEVYLAGSILGSTSHAAIYTSSQAFEMEIAETGTLTGRSTAIELSTLSWATITNHGLITTGGAHAINFIENFDNGQYDISTFSVVNTGEITTSGVAVVFSSNQVQNRTLSIENSGTITGFYAVYMAKASDFEPSNADRLNLVNDGIINGAITTVGLSGLDYLSNTGTITGPIYLDQGNDLMTNTGTITGSIDLGDGDDVITNTALISGSVDLGFGNDQFVNSGTVTGAVSTGGGDDQLTNSGTLNDTLDLGAGNDRLRNSGTLNGVTTLGEGDDLYRAIGNASAVDVFGQAGNDSLYGGDGDDLLWGGHGDDVLFGGLGNDTLGADEGADWIVGGAGFDYLSLAWASSGQTVDLLDASKNIGLTEGDTIQGIEGIRGSDYDDLLLGTAQANHLKGHAGNDRLFGRGGSDTLAGHEGNDTLDGGDGHDVLRGGVGEDMLYGRNGNDVLRGEDGDDTLVGGVGNDTMFGGAGNDVFVFGLRHGRDVVQDLELGDIVELSGLAGRTAEQVIDLYGQMSVDGARLTFATGHTILFKGADLDLLESSLSLV